MEAYFKSYWEFIEHILGAQNMSVESKKEWMQIHIMGDLL